MPPPSGKGGGTSPRKFIQEAWGELRKVQWPTRPHLLQAVLVVGFVTLVFAVYLTIVDFLVVRGIRFITPA